MSCVVSEEMSQIVHICQDTKVFNHEYLRFQNMNSNYLIFPAI